MTRHRIQCPFHFESDAITAHKRNVAKGQTGSNGTLLDHLVGADEQNRWDFEAERPGGPQIDH
jgi:hypothetical protein